MSEDAKGLRAVPPPLLLAFAVWIAMTTARLIFLVTAKEPWGAIRFNLVNEGTSFAAQLLAMFGAFELAHRSSGCVARGIRVAAWGFAGVLAVDVTYGFVSFMDKPWEHEWIYKVADYGYFVPWLAVPVGLAIANWRERRALAIGLVVIALLAYPPPFLSKAMFGWLPEGKSGYAIESMLRLVRIVSLFAGFAVIARGATTTDRVLAANGLRLAATSLWLRLIAAIAVPLLTLMVIGSRGNSGIAMLDLATFAALVINIVALTQFGIGGLRSARASVPELGRWSCAFGGAASLWGAGVMLAQLSSLYKVLYSTDALYGRSDMAEYAHALSIALPLVVTAGAAVIAVAISGFAARRGNDELRAHAQSSGAGFVTLSLVALAITAWMVPDATSPKVIPLLLLLATGAGLVAIVMMAKLLNLAADEVDKEPGLPTASLIHSGTRSP